jgi:hypothetical protein
MDTALPVDSAYGFLFSVRLVQAVIVALLVVVALAATLI